jgi:hypothetical protein
MPNPRPYALRNIQHVSSSAIKNYCTCEALGAYRRNFVGVPTVPLPVSLVFGIAIHKLLERAGKNWWKNWKTTGCAFKNIDESEKWSKAAIMYVKATLDEKHGARGESTPPEKILWFREKFASGMTVAELQYKIEETKIHYCGQSYNIMEAFRQQFENGFPDDLKEMIFEQSIQGDKFSLVAEDGQKYPLRGSIDTVRIFTNTYEADDYKTGWVISKYKDRVFLVNDLQMTLYSHALQQRYGNPPARMFIQPLDISSEYLEKHGPETLRSKRILVPGRTDEHIKDAINLGRDVHEMVERVVRWRYYTYKEREEWQPRSLFGRMAGFSRSVQERRFVARVGQWCDSCQFVNLCVEDHADDWKRSQQEHSQIIPNEEISASVINVADEKPSYETGMLFDVGGVKRKAPRKTDADLKREMVASGNFIPKHKLMAELKRLRAAVLSGESCPCERLELYPVWLMSALPLFMKKGRTPNLQELASACPHPDCPRKKIIP